MDSIERLLFESELDISQSKIVRSDALQLAVQSKLGLPRILLGLLFGIPCLMLLHQAWSDQGFAILLALVFCPPLALLSLLFGCIRQEKAFKPTMATAIKSWQLLNLRRERQLPLPKEGALITYKQWSSGSDSGGCYFYYIAVAGLPGFVFCIARDEARRDAFANELASFLGYSLREEGERFT